MKKGSKAKTGPKPITVSLYPLTPEQALRAFMAVNPKKVLSRERKASKGGA